MTVWLLLTSSLGTGLVLVCISSNYIEFCIRKTQQAGAPDCVYCYDLALHWVDILTNAMLGVGKIGMIKATWNDMISGNNKAGEKPTVGKESQP